MAKKRTRKKAPDKKRPVAWKKGITIGDIPVNSKSVHVSVYPTLTNLNALLEHCPRLKKVSIPPAFEKLIITQSHRNLLASHGVELTIERIVRSKGFDNREPHITPSFRKRAEFYRNLNPKAQAKLEELRRYGLEIVKIADRYFCINGEPYVPLLSLFGQSKYRYNTLREGVPALLVYLGAPEDLVGNNKAVYSRAVTIEEFARKSRKEAKEKKLDSQERKRPETYKKLPEGLPRSEWEIFYRLTAIIEKVPGFLESLKSFYPTSYEAVVQYYGVADGEYHTLIEIGKNLGENTKKGKLGRERIRQLRDRGLEYLGIRRESLVYATPE